jgi:hypothetical protein
LSNFKFFLTFAEIFVSQGAPPKSSTPVANFPPVSTTPAANLAPGTAGVVDTGGKFSTGVNNTGRKFATGVNNTGLKKLEYYQTADTLKVPKCDILISWILMIFLS